MSVAMAPDDAAAKLCTLAACTDEFAGTSLPVMSTRQDQFHYRKIEVIKRSNGRIADTCFLLYDFVEDDEESCVRGVADG